MLAFFALSFALIVCCPLCILPAKDALEMLVFKQETRMSGNENFFCTSIVVTVCFLAAVSVKNIASIIQIAGATSSTAVGYCLPALFYLKMD